MKPYLSILLAGIFLQAILPACSGPIDGPAVSTRTEVHPTPSASQFAAPSATSSPTVTPTREAPTWTPAPTLVPAEARAVAADLFLDNAGCQLPCWWGFTPGQTPWQEAKHFLETFSLGVYESDSAGPVRYATVKIPTPENVQIYPVHDYAIRDGLIESITIDDPGRSTTFGFLEILRTYGKPSEVWIRTYSEGVREDPPSFEVALFYPKHGIDAAFGARARVVGDKVRGCLEQAVRPALGLWSPELPVTFLETAHMFMWDHEGWAFRPLEEATGMDVETFFEVFSDPNNTSCLETPADLWTPQF